VNSNASAKPIKIRRQAVVLIHGMGEQRPNRTLRPFVSALVGRSAAIIGTVDPLSEILGVRRLKVRDLTPETDFLNSTGLIKYLLQTGRPFSGGDCVFFAAVATIYLPSFFRFGCLAGP
jgi:hypothetical protein